MRSLLWLTVLAASACTRPNPDAISIGAHDLATPPLGGGRDLAGTPPTDFSNGGADDLASPPDLARALGTACGTMHCNSPNGACCIENGSNHCTAANPVTCGGGRLISCDGPEDCTMFASNVCCVTSSGGGGPSSQCRFTCGGGETPMCHALSDCPPLSGWVACCPIDNYPYARCSKNAC
jgi:hypothetical protein